MNVLAIHNLASSHSLSSLAVCDSLSHVIDNGNGGGGSGDGGGSGSGGGCRPRNVSLGGAAVEIKHFNYSRLVGGASHRKQSCDKDRWKKKRV